MNIDKQPLLGPGLRNTAFDRQIYLFNVSCWTQFSSVTFCPPEADRTENTSEMTEKNDRCYALLFLKVLPDMKFVIPEF